MNGVHNLECYVLCDCVLSDLHIGKKNDVLEKLFFGVLQCVKMEEENK